MFVKERKHEEKINIYLTHFIRTQIIQLYKRESFINVSQETF